MVSKNWLRVLVWFGVSVSLFRLVRSSFIAVSSGSILAKRPLSVSMNISGYLSLMRYGMFPWMSSSFAMAYPVLGSW